MSTVLTPKRQAAMAKWARFRGMGRGRFVLQFGVLFWGGLMFLAMGLGFTAMMIGKQAFSPSILLLNACVWASGGVLFGLLTWHANEKLFRQFTAAGGKVEP